MTSITYDMVLRFISNARKVDNREVGSKSLYHYRIGLKGINGPYIDVKYREDEASITTTELEIVYNGTTMFTARDSQVVDLKKAIATKEQDIEEELMNNKKQEFIKIVEDL